MKYFILPLLPFIAFPAFCQTETCLHNLDHPDYVSFSQIVDSETIVREYILHVPQNYNADTATPLVINLHGFGDCAADYEGAMEYYEFNDLADQENFIAVYPQGAYRPEKEDTYWEPGDPGVENIYDNDLYFMEQLIEHIDASYNINLEQVFACGYSNGGMMAYSLACHRSEVYSGIGIMSGALLDWECDMSNSVPMIMFHGIGDDVLPYNGNEWYQSVPEVVSFWLDQNGISENSLIQTALNNGNVVLEEYFEAGEINSCLTFFTVHEEYGEPGGHVWFSEEMDGVTPNQRMWDFFQEGCLPPNSTTELKPKIRIHPNPFNDQIIIELEESSSDKIYSIYALEGSLVKTGIINSSQNIVDLSDLSSRLYILRIGNTFIKLIKS